MFLNCTNAQKSQERVSSIIGSAAAPDGYMVLDELPPMESDSDMNELIGKPVMCGFEIKNVMGWFMGTIHSRKLSPTDLKKTPSANFVVKYNKSITKNKHLHGCVACELSERTHGPSVWWVLVQKVGALAETVEQTA